MIDADGTDRRQLSDGGGWDPVWSPDGTLILFSRGGPGWLRSITPDGTDLGRLTDGPAYHPVWSPVSR